MNKSKIIIGAVLIGLLTFASGMVYHNMNEPPAGATTIVATTLKPVLGGLQVVTDPSASDEFQGKADFFADLVGTLQADRIPESVHIEADDTIEGTRVVRVSIPGLDNRQFLVSLSPDIIIEGVQEVTAFGEGLKGRVALLTAAPKAAPAGNVVTIGDMQFTILAEDEAAPILRHHESFGEEMHGLKSNIRESFDHIVPRRGGVRSRTEILAAQGLNWVEQRNYEGLLAEHAELLTALRQKGRKLKYLFPGSVVQLRRYSNDEPGADLLLRDTDNAKYCRVYLALVRDPHQVDAGAEEKILLLRLRRWGKYEIDRVSVTWVAAMMDIDLDIMVPLSTDGMDGFVNREQFTQLLQPDDVDVALPVWERYLAQEQAASKSAPAGEVVSIDGFEISIGDEERTSETLGLTLMLKIEQEIAPLLGDYKINEANAGLSVPMDRSKPYVIPSSIIQITSPYQMLHKAFLLKAVDLTGGVECTVLVRINIDFEAQDPQEIKVNVVEDFLSLPASLSSERVSALMKYMPAGAIVEKSSPAGAQVTIGGSKFEVICEADIPENSPLFTDFAVAEGVGRLKVLLSMGNVLPTEDDINEAVASWGNPHFPGEIKRHEGAGIMGYEVKVLVDRYAGFDMLFMRPFSVPRGQGHPIDRSGSVTMALIKPSLTSSKAAPAGAEMTPELAAASDTFTAAIPDFASPDLNVESLQDLVDRAIPEFMTAVATAVGTGELPKVVQANLQHATDLKGTISSILQVHGDGVPKMKTGFTLILDKSAFSGQLEIAREIREIKALEDRLGMTIEIIDPENVAALSDKHDATNAIVIAAFSNIDTFKPIGARTVGITKVPAGQYVPLTSLAIFAKAMITIDSGSADAGALKSIISNIYRSLTDQPLPTEMLDRYIADPANYIIMLVLPTPTVVYEEGALRTLHMQAVAALRAA